jgi:hypothetical protein
VEPPTKITPLSSSARKPASRSARLHTAPVRCTSGNAKASNSSRVTRTGTVLPLLLGSSMSASTVSDCVRACLI